MSHEHRMNAPVSRAFTLDELASALSGRNPTVTGSANPAETVAAAALAPHVWARNALVSLCASASDGCALRLVSERALSPRETLQVWPDERLLAAARVPYLALHNIQDKPHARYTLGGAQLPYYSRDRFTGRQEYVCHECGARFEHPNPLKVHIYLGCAPPRAPDFWRTLLARLRDCETRLETRPEARLEELATEWGRARGGAHLCLYCGKAYSRKYGLKIHIRTHTGYRPLRCRYCARAFGDPSNLNKHVRLHSQHEHRARHACPVCAQVLPRRRDLQRHVRTHHTSRENK